MTRSIIAALFGVMLALFMGISHGFETPISDLFNNEMTTISRSETYTGKDKVTKLESIYVKFFAPLLADVRDLDSSSLRTLFQASDMLAYYTLFSDYQSNTNYVTYMQRVFNELKRRSLITAADTANMFDALIAARRMHEAKALKDESISLSKKITPVIKKTRAFDEATAAELVVEQSGSVVKARNVELAADYRIIVVSGCHISQDAVKEIDANPVLREAFLKGNTIWLAPADRNFDLEQIQKWNRDFPRQNITISYKNSSWHGIDFSRIPTFYFYRDGNLIGEHIGWKEGGVPVEITSMLRSMGLLD